MFDDLDVFFSELDSTVAVFTVSGSKRKVRGYFDNGFFDANVGQVVLNTTQPRFTCKASDVEDVERSSAVTVLGKSYTVLEVQPEGTGTSTVILTHVK